MPRKIVIKRFKSLEKGLRQGITPQYNNVQSLQQQNHSHHHPQQMRGNKVEQKQIKWNIRCPK